mmetsp:Transcript_36138/g.84916  ORF Transcript_36138/g.84916 Transcript_36138/m.84916 type:complete len:263 (+) Transcript_36138:391-1179(+)
MIGDHASQLLSADDLDELVSAEPVELLRRGLVRVDSRQHTQLPASPVAERDQIPKPAHTRGVSAAGPHGHDLPIVERVDSCWVASVYKVVVPELPVGIHPARVQVGSRHLRHDRCVIPPQGHLPNDGADALDFPRALLRHRDGAVSELPVGVLSPGVEAAVGGDGGRVEAAGVDADGVGRGERVQLLRLQHLARVRHPAVAPRPFAPRIHLAVLREHHRVALSARDLDDLVVLDARHLQRRRRRRKMPQPKPAFVAGAGHVD